MATVRVPIEPTLLVWARSRGNRDDDAMRRKFAKWDRWVAGEEHPTLKQAQDLARFSHVPFGMLLLPRPPRSELPIPDFRRGRGALAEPSQNLLDIIHLAQRRQDWYRDHLQQVGADELTFVGSGRDRPVDEVAAAIRSAFDFDMPRRGLRSADDARKHLVRKFEELGGLVSVSSMVGNDTHRSLDPEEVQGFTLHDRIAPYVFVNAADTKATQVFSLLHELAHVWHGDTGLSAEGFGGEGDGLEAWCNKVAAEAAVPKADLRTRFDPAAADLTRELDRLAKAYLCSTVVILLRLRDTNLLRGVDFDAAYRAEVDRLSEFKAGRGDGGGDFYLNQPYRIGETLSRTLIRDALAGRTPFTEAMSLMSFSNMSVFDKYAAHLGEA